jgi:hypothetical protein
MKTLSSLLLAALFPLMVSAALAQPKPEEKKAEETAKPEAVKPKPDEVVIDIKRSGPPECYPKPVMTDAEIETCKRARELWNQKK